MEAIDTVKQSEAHTLIVDSTNSTFYQHTTTNSVVVLGEEQHTHGSHLFYYQAVQYYSVWFSKMSYSNP